MLGGEEGDEVFASTFHSACVRILRRWAEEIGYPRSFTIYDTDVYKRQLVNLVLIILLSMPCVLGYNLWAWDGFAVFGGAVLDLSLIHI